MTAISDPAPGKNTLAGTVKFNTAFYKQDYDFGSNQLYLTSYHAYLFGVTIPNFDGRAVELMSPEDRAAELYKKVTMNDVAAYASALQSWIIESNAKNNLLVFSGSLAFATGRNLIPNVHFVVNLVTQMVIIFNEDDHIPADGTTPARENPVYVTARKLSSEEFRSITLDYRGLTLPTETL